ncbi:D-aminoacyl-tRNA deacylase [Coraliomargarita sp. SDUM461004]|uniref:D-aminoacyl-tRNA deacylase n=1 Tax=Thalassobacterium sedimentorum TaxID=3041258 RepID=A0ABU1AHX0_9BACT|nr:D-aminoacyl-tRNA deacylase [Coraliomargarita sp. SDUM461004]MDQ8194412.1 D-aminoacyl-tRNA deacylase [Coraliomargarita sp. SDUM461004]
MRAVIQRVSSAKVAVAGRVVGQITGPGLLIFLGVGREDTQSDADWLVGRIVKLRVFESEPGRMDQSLLAVSGQALVISQFTLYGSLKKGNRPSFNRAALPEQAVPLYEYFVTQLSQALGIAVPTGEFGAHMNIDAQNDGPVTLVVDSQARDF